MHEAMEKSKRICSQKDKLLAMLECGQYEIDSDDGSKITDMIKDLSEAEKDCWKACYYKKIVEAMEEDGGYEEEEGRYGYNPNRSASTGRYTSGKGRGGRGGRMGYRIPDMDIHYPDAMERVVSGGDYDAKDPWGKGKTHPYDEFRDARKHYTETASMNDKEHMDMKAKETCMEFIEDMRDIWKTADPALKKEMKANIQKLVAEMA